MYLYSYLHYVVDNLWISRPGCSWCVLCQVLDVGVRQYVAGGARDLNAPAKTPTPPFCFGSLYF